MTLFIFILFDIWKYTEGVQREVFQDSQGEKLTGRFSKRDFSGTLIKAWGKFWSLNFAWYLNVSGSLNYPK